MTDDVQTFQQSIETLRAIQKNDSQAIKIKVEQHGHAGAYHATINAALSAIMNHDEYTALLENDLEGALAPYRQRANSFSPNPSEDVLDTDQFGAAIDDQRLAKLLDQIEAHVRVVSSAAKT